MSIRDAAYHAGRICDRDCLLKLEVVVRVATAAGPALPVAIALLEVVRKRPVGGPPAIIQTVLSIKEYYCCLLLRVVFCSLAVSRTNVI